jgi:hypothetical protein
MEKLSECMRLAWLDITHDIYCQVKYAGFAKCGAIASNFDYACWERRRTFDGHVDEGASVEPDDGADESPHVLHAVSSSWVRCRFTGDLCAAFVEQIGTVKLLDQTATWGNNQKYHQDICTWPRWRQKLLEGRARGHSTLGFHPPAGQQQLIVSLYLL